MANRTAKDAHSVKGTNPQYLVEKIIRTRIYDCKYWKEDCFGLTAELVVDKAIKLKYVGGIFGSNIKPTPFLCLILKLLQIQPEKEIIVEFIRNEDFKYVRAVGALYMRLTGTAIDCYKYLEPLYNDYRKIRTQSREGKFVLSHMDEFVDNLLREERVCDIILPRLQKRQVLEESNDLEQRISALDEDMDIDLDEEDEDEEVVAPPSPPPQHSNKERDRRRASPAAGDRRRSSPKRRRSRSRSPRDRGGDRSSRREAVRDPFRKPSSRSYDDRKSSHHHSHRSSDDRRESRDHPSRDRHHHQSSSSSSSRADVEVQQANEQRAKLGLPPLRT